ncbi:SH3 domain-containing protein [Acuticoccus sp.]|uniref:SH3 domain-containing protein n=1 Tax=Acuticoccus sp. TaxID=1904378 RepID=UPI003B51F925
MLRGFILALVAVLTSSAGAATANSIDALSIASDAWLRTGPSTAHARITGLPRGTVVVEIADVDTAFEGHSSRWVHVHVLEGRAEGRDGWVWGRFVDCCRPYEWLD